MALFWRKKALLLKTEVTYGTDPTPSGAANAIQATEVSINPMEGSDVSRNIDKPYLGGDDVILIDSYVTISFKIELAGSGVAGTAPAWGPVLLACGFEETIVAVTSVTYTPVSTAFGSATIYFNVDGILHKILGVRGNATLMFERGVPMLSFTMQGLFVQPTDTALPTVDLTDFQTPKPTSSTNTPTLTLAGVALEVERLEINIGNQVENRFLVNSEAVRIADRSVTGSLVCEAVALATFNPYARADARTKGALALVHGTEAGNIATIGCPVVGVGRPAVGESQGITTWTLPLMMLPSSGNDDISIALT